VRRTDPLAQQQCLIRCRHCRIFFLTHRRNHRRLHLVSCPFGCRKEHERRESIRRTAAYYREHPDRKRTLNPRRYRLVPGSVSSGPGTVEPGENPPGALAEIAANQPWVAKGAAAGALPGHDRRTGDPCSSPPCPPALTEVLPKAQDPELIEHVRFIVSLLEGRQVSLEELWETLLNFSRQRTIGWRRKIDHTVAWLNAQPP
jgi:hypothetical protein